VVHRVVHELGKGRGGTAHPDDPALGVYLDSLIRQGYFLQLDDRDENVYSLHPTCEDIFSHVHNRTWVVHHADDTMVQCMWDKDLADGLYALDATQTKVTNIDVDRSFFPDLCSCVSDKPGSEWGDALSEFYYPTKRFLDEL